MSNVGAISTGHASASAAPPGRIGGSRENHVGWAIFDNSSRHNAISLGMWRELATLLESYRTDPDVRVVVVTGAGEKSFVSGADISEFESRRSTPEGVAEYSRIAREGQRAIDALGKPLIAMIRGFCMGGGIGLALNCDLRIAADDAVFAIPAVRLGLAYPFTAVQALTSVVGPAYAKEILYTGRRLNAVEALRIGLVNHVVPAADLRRTVQDYATMIADAAPLTVSASKLAVEHAVHLTDTGLAEVEKAVAACMASEDYKEGRRAFSEKRKPNFKGR
jgi:enoyl-CoA hydratase/carnithine racemase